MKNEWGLPVIFAVALHLGLIALLVLVSPAVSYRLNTSASNPQPVVHAAVVDASQVVARVQAIQVHEQQQQQAQEQRLAQIEAAQQKADQQRQLALKQAQTEEKRLTQLKAEVLKKQQEQQARAQILQQQQQQRQRELAAAKQKQAELAAKQSALQQQLLQQQLANEQKQLTQVQQMQGLVDQYRARILMAIANQWLIPDGADPTISCVFTIDLTPAGVVSHVQLVKSSGNAALDRSAETAIYKASPLPVPKDSSAFTPFQHFNLKMTPQDIKP